MKRLKKGYRRLQSDVLSKNPEFFENLKKGQNPEFLILSCIDSRVDPTALFQAEEGLFLQARNVANIVHPYDQATTNGISFAAALQFAVVSLKVKEIIILGHTHCGGVEKLMSIHANPKQPANDLVSEWVKVAMPAADKGFKISQRTGADLHKTCGKQNVLNSLQNLMTYPFVKEAVDAGTLNLNGLYVHVGYKDLEHYNPKRKRFVSLKKRFTSLKHK